MADQPYQVAQRPGDRRVEAKRRRVGDDGAVDGLDFRRPAGQHVLQHRRLMAAVVGEGHVQRPPHAIRIHRQPERPGDGQCLRDDGEHQRTPGLMVGDRPDRQARDGGDRVHRGVEGDLLPDRHLHLGIGDAIQTGRAEHGGDLLHGRVGMGLRRPDAHRTMTVRGDVSGTGKVGRPACHAGRHAGVRHRGSDGRFVAEAVLDGEDPAFRPDQMRRTAHRRFGMGSLCEDDREIAWSG